MAWIFNPFSGKLDYFDATTVAAHKDNHDPEDGSDALDTAAPSELAGVQAAGVGSSHSFARADHVHQVQESMEDNHLVTINDAAAADNEFCKFTATGGIDGQAPADVLADLSDQAEAVFSFNDQNVTNISDIDVDSVSPNDSTWDAIAMVCDKGATLPTSPVAGQWFLHTPASSVPTQILYCYDGNSWRTSSIRKYGAIDEQTWSKTVYIPLAVGTSGWTKDASNPVLSMTDIDADFTGTVYHPCVAFDGTYYWMFVVSNEGAGPSQRAEIYVLRATTPEADGADWTLWNNGNPIIPMGGASPDNRYVENPSVVIDYNASGTGTDFKWKMLYQGMTGSPTLSSVCYAYASDPPSTSSDTWTWTKYASNPVIAYDDTDFEPNWGYSLIKLGKRFIFFCKNKTVSNLRVGYSSDCINWTYIGIPITQGAGGTWDDGVTSYCCLYFDSGQLYAFYSGHDGTNYRIGMAQTTNLQANTAFIKDITNPVLSVGAAGAWDDYWVFSPSVLRIGKTFHLWFSGNTNTYNYQIGHASLSFEDV